MNYDNDIEEDVATPKKAKNAVVNIIVVFVILFVTYKLLSFNSAVLLGLSFIVVSIVDVERTLNHENED